MNISYKTMSYKIQGKKEGRSRSKMEEKQDGGRARGQMQEDMFMYVKLEQFLGINIHKNNA